MIYMKCMPQELDNGDADPLWHLDFTIPELSTFSGFVKEAIKTGIVSSKARREITQILRMYIMAQTAYKKPEQYTTVYHKLITKYPALQDTTGTTRIVSANNLNVCSHLLTFGNCLCTIHLKIFAGITVTQQAESVW